MTRPRSGRRLVSHQPRPSWCSPENIKEVFIMKITEIASLLGKGYNVAEIKELAEISATTPEVLEMAKTGTKVSDLKDLIALADSGQDEPGTPPPDPDAGKDDPDADLKTQIETLTKENEDLRKTVGDIQKDNAAKDNSGGAKELDIIDTLNNMMKECT